MAPLVTDLGIPGTAGHSIEQIDCMLLLLSSVKVMGDREADDETS